jgi:TRAP-type C4-dicarboxylate transport system substrate-binding protein
MVSLANQDWFYSLPEEYQKIIRDASKEAWGVQERTMIEKAESSACQTMRDFGLTEYELSDAEKQTFIDASAAVYDEYVGTISDELMQMVAK